MPRHKSNTSFPACAPFRNTREWIWTMQRLRAFADKLSALISSDRAPDAAIEDRSVFSRLAVPYTFSPSLSLGDGLLSIAVCLTRIFSACGLFAVWGGISALTFERHRKSLLARDRPAASRTAISR